jgi:hypothetical protein
MAALDCQVSDLSGLTMTVNVEYTKAFWLRLRLAIFFMRLACKASGMTLEIKDGDGNL